jgi:hypothetical protein
VILMGQVLASGPVLEYSAQRSVHNTLSSTIAHRVSLTGSFARVQLVNLDASEPLYAFVSLTGDTPDTVTAAVDDSFTVPAGGVLSWDVSGVGFGVSLVGDGNAYSVIGYDSPHGGVR